jgi:hypothetical protein
MPLQRGGGPPSGICRLPLKASAELVQVTIVLGMGPARLRQTLISRGYVSLAPQAHSVGRRQSRRAAVTPVDRTQRPLPIVDQQQRYPGGVESLDDCESLVSIVRRPSGQCDALILQDVELKHVLERADGSIGRQRTENLSTLAPKKAPRTLLIRRKHDAAFHADAAAETLSAGTASEQAKLPADDDESDPVFRRARSARRIEPESAIMGDGKQATNRGIDVAHRRARRELDRPTHTIWWRTGRVAIRNPRGATEREKNQGGDTAKDPFASQVLTLFPKFAERHRVSNNADR